MTYYELLAMALDTAIQQRDFLNKLRLRTMIDQLTVENASTKVDDIYLGGRTW